MIRRVIMCCIWFVVLYFGLAVVLGFFVGSTSVKTQGTAFVDGQEAGARFGKEHGKIIFLVSAFVAVAGTAIGVLPGTAPAIKEN